MCSFSIAIAVVFALSFAFMYTVASRENRRRNRAAKLILDRLGIKK